MNNSKKSSNNKLIVLLVLILIFVGFVVIMAAGSSQNQNTNTQATSSASQLQECINNAHSTFDSAIAFEEGHTNPSNLPKSQLDMAIANCHQQYGY